jgi:hypothetical protein
MNEGFEAPILNLLPPRENVQLFKHEKFLNFFLFVGQVCLPRTGSEAPIPSRHPLSLFVGRSLSVRICLSNPNRNG